jgi:hypothetical protein
VVSIKHPSISTLHIDQLRTPIDCVETLQVAVPIQLRETNLVGGVGEKSRKPFQRALATNMDEPMAPPMRGPIATAAKITVTGRTKILRNVDALTHDRVPPLNPNYCGAVWNPVRVAASTHQALSAYSVRRYGQSESSAESRHRDTALLRATASKCSGGAPPFLS